MEDNHKLVDLSSSCYYGCGDGIEMEQKQRITESDHMNAFQYTGDKVDSFVIDMDAYSSGINKDATNTNSRITRSLSRKGSQRVGDRKLNGITTLSPHSHDINNNNNNKDAISALCSPKGTLTGSCSTPDKAASMAVGSTDHFINTTATETKSITRRNSFIRSSSSCPLDPKRVLIFFATLSSMGTMLLIYFTLITNKQNEDQFLGDTNH
ncbi:uncharacterized protein [Cicer arietinum]|uniref:Uncharacterized protein LOC101502614 isoform X2 n=1 Tax=Cicer arietinum TaxID=3827 RepID=A0A1S2YX42_CICAR|nr:uncharacterized protein LOC101502614 isoform X2 [Cicer arietinum]XP_004511338.1 uncharacterized protein LOC101502614 isoform X2 [Cicer arietinum]